MPFRAHNSTLSPASLRAAATPVTRDASTRGRANTANAAHENATDFATSTDELTSRQAVTRRRSGKRDLVDTPASNAQAQDSTPHLRSFCQQHSRQERHLPAVIADKSLAAQEAIPTPRQLAPYGGGDMTHWRPCLNARTSTTRRRAFGDRHHGKGSRYLNDIWQDRELPDELHLLRLGAPPTPLATLCDFQHTTSDHKSMRTSHGAEKSSESHIMECEDFLGQQPRRPAANRQQTTQTPRTQTQHACSARLSSLASRLRLQLRTRLSFLFAWMAMV